MSASAGPVGIGAHAGFGNYSATFMDVTGSEGQITFGTHLKFNSPMGIGLEGTFDYWKWSESDEVLGFESSFTDIPIGVNVLWGYSPPKSPLTLNFGGSSAIHLLKSEVTISGVSVSESESHFGVGPVASAEYKATPTISFLGQFKYHFLLGDAFKDPITDEGTKYNTLYILGGFTFYP
jgi:outer membrane scaffolding protein for murein synthesis (MipA/OmpV family)